GLEPASDGFTCVEAPSDGTWSRWACAGGANSIPTKITADATSSSVLFIVSFPPGWVRSIREIALGGWSARDDESPRAVHVSNLQLTEVDARAHALRLERGGVASRRHHPVHEVRDRAAA